MDKALKIFWQYANEGKSYADCLSAYKSANRNKHPGVKVGDTFVMDGEEQTVISTQNQLPPEIQEFKESILDKIKPGDYEVTGAVNISPQK